MQPAQARAAIGFSFLLAAFAAGFLLFGEFGGWYDASGGGYMTSRYNYDRDDYDPVWQGTGSASWDSDGLFSEPVLVAPILIAVAALGGAMFFLGRLGLDPTRAARPALLRSGILATVAAGTIAVAALFYAASMGQVDEWWFGSAFWAGFVNSTLLAALAFFLMARAAHPSTLAPL